MGHKPMGEFRRGLTAIPLIGPLFACRREDYFAATREFIIIIAFATATFWLSALFLVILDSGNTLSISAVFDLTTKEGQLFIFATALLGPILVFATEDPPNARPFPARTWIIFALVLLAIVCSGSYAFTRGAGALNPKSPIPLNQAFLANAAIACALIAASFRYIAILYNKYRMRPEEVKASEESFNKEFARRHRNEALAGEEE
jgi:hypothetical protein